jgi:zinc transport system substrate-binding protein
MTFAPEKVQAQNAQGQGAKPLVAVSILPQAEFVQRIAGNKVDVLTLVGPGADPHSYEPTPRQMADLSKAQIWFTVGIEFEIPLVPKIKSLYPKMLLVNTAKDVKLRKLDPNPDGESGWDPHTWLGHEAAKQEITVIYQTLATSFPSNANYFRDNYNRYIADIDSVFAGLSKKLAPYKGTTVYVYHPSFGYFLDNFGIVQKAVEVGGKEPTQKDLAQLIKQAQKDKVKVVFVQKQFSKTAASAVASAIGGKVVEIDPLAPDWLNNITVIGNAIAQSEAK